jgi:hypothetical protein
VKTPSGSQFCCLALNGPRLKIKQEYELAPGLYVSDKQEALALEPHWVEWLGTIQANSFKESSLYITAVTGTLSSLRDDAPLHQTLDNRVRLFHHALVLLGCGYNDAMLLVGGEAYSSGGLHIGPIRPGLTPCFRPFYRKSRAIEPADLEKAAKILSNLELIYRHVPDRLYRRLRKGFNVWVRGAQEGQEWTERFHAFVRATEAIFKCTIARKRDAKRRKSMKRPWRDITSTFLQRGQTIVGSGRSNEALLKQLYGIRSNIEHIKDIKPSVRGIRGVDENEAFLFRALQAEILASTIYERILTDDALLSAFSIEAKVEGYWARKEDQRQRLWGPPLDIQAAAQELFASQKIPDWY